MSEDELLVVEYVQALVGFTQEKYEKAKIILWYLCGNDENARIFLKQALEVSEKYRPKMIEMK